MEGAVARPEMHGSIPLPMERLETMCIGGGQGLAAIFELAD